MANQSFDYVTTETMGLGKGVFSQSVVGEVPDIHSSVFSPINPETDYLLVSILPKHRVWMNNKWNIVR